MNVDAWNESASRTIESEGVNVFPVIAASHVLLTETNGVLSCWDTVKDLEICLRDALKSRKMMIQL